MDAVKISGVGTGNVQEEYRILRAVKLFSYDSIIVATSLYICQTPRM